MAGKLNIADYLYLKLENKSNYDNVVGATEQDRFNNLSSDSDRLEAINFNNVDDNISVPFLMAYYSLDLTNASNYLGSIKLKSIEKNAHACKVRFENKAEGWWAILFTFFDVSVAQEIETVITSSGHFNFYCNSARFGTEYGDTEDAILDFINKTGGYALGGISLVDFELKTAYKINNDETDYVPVQTALTQFFRG